MDYQEFLAQKRIRFQSMGIEIDKATVHPLLFPFQSDLVAWALRKGRAAIFADTGLGKTFMQVEWARLTGTKTLIVAPLSVAKQTVNEARKIDCQVIYVRSQEQADALPGMIYITNYEMVEKFNPVKFDAVVLDECFPPDTPIDVFSIDDTQATKYIKDITIQDQIINASGVDNVKQIYKRPIKRAVHIKAKGEFTCSENHPIFTMYGWRCAQDLQPGDYIMETATAVRLVREGILPDRWTKMETVLRSILLSEMAHESPDLQGESSQQGSRQEARSGKVEMVQGWKSNSPKGNGADTEYESDEQSGYSRESIIEIAGDEAQTFRAWGKWDWFDCSTEDFTGCTREQLESGICFVTGPTNSGLSNRLQARLSQFRSENKHRSRRVIAQREADGDRSETGYKAGFSRVESIEILEQGHPELEKYRDANGIIYFYDIKAERHPSFSINGMLVHNSSILKSLAGKTRTKLIDMFSETRFRLCCTATPAPNDISEIANHSEFLGIMTRAEMLASFFVHDDAGWRLRGYAANAFYRWMASWGMSIKKPSDLGYDDNGFILPPLNINSVITDSGYTPEGQLLFTGLKGIANRSEVRKTTIASKVSEIADMVNNSDEQWIIWCGLNDESTDINNAVDDAVEVSGSDSLDYKIETLDAFQSGHVRVLVTKTKIAGFGMNFQNCHNMAFMGLSDSFEGYYQAVRRCWRFGQTAPVNVYVFLADVEQEILGNVLEKEQQAKLMSNELIGNIQKYEVEEISNMVADDWKYQTDTVKGSDYLLMMGDSVERIKEIGDSSVDLSVFSPPFMDLYTYSPTERDLGNSSNSEDFFFHFGLIAEDLLRITRPGRICAVHTADVPALLSKDGYIGLKDFPGMVINLFVERGWVYHGRVTIDKNPQAQAIRTHSKALLFVQMEKDSTWSRPAIGDYVLLFRKPGENQTPVKPVENGDITRDKWIEWAHPIWYGIRETDTLQYTTARDINDDKHICPLQLGTIERCIALYSNPGETVFTPFMGIGSEVYQALKMKRKGIGIELKQSYFEIAVKNIKNSKSQSIDLFAWAEQQDGVA